MADLPFLPLWIDDFEAATPHLTLAEDGAYNRLMRLCWRTPGCSIPAEDDWIRRRMRVTAEEYEAVVKPILDEFFTRTRGGRYEQKRLVAEFEDAAGSRKNRQRAGAAGGKASAAKRQADKETLEM